MKPHRQAEWSFAKLALGVGAAVIGVGMALGGGGDGKTPPPDFGKLFKDIGADKPAKKPAKKKPRVVGVVADHVDGQLLIVPFSDDPMTTVDATASQRDRCPRDARYPDCLRRR